MGNKHRLEHAFNLTGLNLTLVLAAGVCALGACASAPPEKQEPRYTIVKNPDQPSQGRGIPAEQQAEIQLLIQNRQPTAQKCYQDELNEKHDRKFQGTVQVLITVGTAGQASDVKIATSTLGSPEVERCLVEKIKEFEFPKLEQPGEIQYTYSFRPAY